MRINFLSDIKTSSIFDLKTNSSLLKNSVIFSIFLILLYLAFSNRFIQDDAFISFRYSQNFAQGHGLVWNIGEAPVEGYTNFLWTVLMSIPFLIHIEPVAFSQVLGILCFFGSLFFTYKLSLYIFKSWFFATAVVLTLGSNYTFSSYATGGLETQLQIFLIMTGAFLTLYITEGKHYKIKYYAILSLIWSLAILTRLDSALLILTMFLYTVWHILKQPFQSKIKVLQIISLMFPVILITGAWFAWKLQYYGSILPNTYFIKVGSSVPLRAGIEYLGYFITEYWIAPFCLLTVCFLRRMIVQKPVFFLILASIGLWCLYIIRVGGDFMEFRFIVPILPFIFIVINYCIHLLKNGNVQLAMVVTILLGSWWHDSTFTGRQGLESIRGLQLHLYGEDQLWAEVGKTLNHNFSGSDVCIATSAAGAIPFYSNLKTIDMLGLNDRWVAREGIKKTDFRPGHQKYPTHEYLYNRQVNFVLGHPQVWPVSYPQKTFYKINDLRQFSLKNIRDDLIPDDSKVIAVPVNEKYVILMYYFIQHPEVDRMLREHTWKTIPIVK